jgi:MFS family permease
MAVGVGQRVGGSRSRPGAPWRRPPVPGSARASLAHRDYRIVYFGSFASNVGSWAQTVVLAPFAYRLAGDSASFAGLTVAAQMGPTLLFATLGGYLANRLPRKRLMIGGAALQAVFALLLAWVVVQPDPARGLFLLAVFGGGLVNSVTAPTFQAVLPELCGRENLPGAIALNSVQMNGARVIGPILVAVTHLGTRDVFVFNAVTFAFVIMGFALVPIGPTPAGHRHRLLDGFRYARQNPVAARILPMLFTFSVLSLPYIGQFATIAERVIGLDSTRSTYKWLYGTWGLGACLGALLMGTVLARFDKRRMIAPGFALFAVCLALFGLNGSVVLAFPIGFLLGGVYFGTITAMLTVLQQHISSVMRAPVMAVWFMFFGGAIPIGVLWAGWVMDHWAVPPVILAGAAWAMVLAAMARDVPERTERWLRTEGAAAG